uniref:Acyl-CoA synthetase n=1 Tax=uncultured bacterium HF186_25m_13D19 TaxID=662888 RepID=C7FPG4_9BACT|nr:acyl-CoA synthetase [uncultured bacterium HF186_25m_13D19]
MTRLFDGFHACPDRLAFSVGGVDLSYRDLDRRSASVAQALKAKGIRPGERVAVQSETSASLLGVIVAHLRLGVIHVPINTRYQADEIDHILEDSQASLVLVDDGAPAADVAEARGTPWVPVDSLIGDPAGFEESWESDTPAMLIYTSGTTGRSKGVALSLNALSANVGATTTLWHWSQDDHLVLALPLFHVHGLGLGVLGTLLTQMSATLHPRFDAERVIEAVAAGGSIFMGVPTMYARLIAHLKGEGQAREALRAARLFTSGSAALPASAHEAFERLTGKRILERYGMSETGFTLSNPYAGERRAGSVGFAVPGYEVRVVTDEGEDCGPGDAGEIWVRGDGLMLGYWGQPEASASAFTEGWFRTGDVARVDEDGYHHILGRRSADIIKSGGFKISALEIEDVLLRDPAVAEVAVVGLPDPEWGERIVAALVLTPGETIDSERLDALSNAHLARFKCPRAYYSLTELPRNALGKLQKHHLTAQLLAIK